MSFMNDPQDLYRTKFLVNLYNDKKWEFTLTKKFILCKYLEAFETTTTTLIASFKEFGIIKMFTEKQTKTKKINDVQKMFARCGKVLQGKT